MLSPLLSVREIRRHNARPLFLMVQKGKSKLHSNLYKECYMPNGWESQLATANGLEVSLHLAIDFQTISLRDQFSKYLCLFHEQK